MYVIGSTQPVQSHAGMNSLGTCTSAVLAEEDEAPNARPHVRDGINAPRERTVVARISSSCDVQAARHVGQGMQRPTGKQGR